MYKRGDVRRITDSYRLSVVRPVQGPGCVSLPAESFRKGKSDNPRRRCKLWCPGRESELSYSERDSSLLISVISGWRDVFRLVTKFFIFSDTHITHGTKLVVS